MTSHYSARLEVEITVPDQKVDGRHPSRSHLRDRIQTTIRQRADLLKEQYDAQYSIEKDQADRITVKIDFPKSALEALILGIIQDELFHDIKYDFEPKFDSFSTILMENNV